MIASTLLAVSMIVFTMVMFMTDTQSSVSNALITGGVSLLSITLSAYIAGAVTEDVQFKKHSQGGDE